MSMSSTQEVSSVSWKRKRGRRRPGRFCSFSESVGAMSQRIIREGLGEGPSHELNWSGARNRAQPAFKWNQERLGPKRSSTSCILRVIEGSSFLNTSFVKFEP